MRPGSAASDRPRGPAVLCFGASAAAAFAAVVFATVFIFSSLSGGFFVEAPWGEISCRNPIHLLLEAVGAWLAWALLRRLCGRLAARPPPAGPPRETALTSAESVFVPIMLVGFVFLLWLRFLYRSYEDYLLHRHDFIWPFWHAHVVSLAMLAGVVVLWYRLRRTDGAFAALAGSCLFLFSPLAFDLTAPVTYAFAAMTVVWLVTSLAGAGALPVRVKVGALAVAPVLMGAIVAWLDATGRGWGAGRVTDHFMLQSAPGLLWILVVAGVFGWFNARRVRRDVLPGAAALGLLGVVLAGARAGTGDVGGVLMIPLVVTLASLGARWLWRETIFSRSVFGRNVLVLLLLGVILGVGKRGLDRGVKPPSDTPERKAIEMRFAEPEEDVH